MPEQGGLSRSLVWAVQDALEWSWQASQSPGQFSVCCLHAVCAQELRFLWWAPLAFKPAKGICLPRVRPQVWCESCSVVSDSLWLHSPWNSPGQNTGVGSPSLLQGIFPTQGLNLGLPHCRQILYQMSHQGRCRCLGRCLKPFASQGGSLSLQHPPLLCFLLGMWIPTRSLFLHSYQTLCGSFFIDLIVQELFC